MHVACSGGLSVMAVLTLRQPGRGLHGQLPPPLVRISHLLPSRRNRPRRLTPFVRPQMIDQPSNPYRAPSSTLNVNLSFHEIRSVTIAAKWGLLGVFPVICFYGLTLLLLSYYNTKIDPGMISQIGYLFVSIKFGIAILGIYLSSLTLSRFRPNNKIQVLMFTMIHAIIWYTLNKSTRFILTALLFKPLKEGFYLPVELMFFLILFLYAIAIISFIRWRYNKVRIFYEPNSPSA